MKSEIFFVKSLADYLEKFIQSIIRNPDSLKSGRRFTNIKLMPREILGAFLICVVVKHISRQDWTLARDIEIGDGMVWCRDKNRYGDVILLEQVYVRIRPKGSTLIEIAEKINNQIQRKIDKGKEYAKNRHLIVFLDVEGEFAPGIVQSFISNVHERFDSYWLFAPGEGLDYSVFLLKSQRDNLTMYKVTINNDFRGWKVEKLGNI